MPTTRKSKLIANDDRFSTSPSKSPVKRKSRTVQSARTSPQKPFTVEEAKKAVENLNKADLNEIKSMRSPPSVVIKTVWGAYQLFEDIDYNSFIGNFDEQW